MTEDECLERFGLKLDVGEAPAIRKILQSQIAAAEKEEGESGLLKLCCIQLFSLSDLSDVLLIWKAKRSSFDNAINIDVQLLCGAGLAATKAYLRDLDSEDARDALKYITECEASGDFERFQAVELIDYYHRYYDL